MNTEPQLNSAGGNVTEKDIEKEVQKIRDTLGGRRQPVLTLDGPLICLRNEWAINIKFEDITYPSVAHAFAASSTDDVAVRKKISVTNDIKKVEYMAKSAKPNFEIDVNRVEKLAQLLLAKFLDPDLRTKLKDTGTAQLVYMNTRGDTVWGVCNNRGFNFLGQTLMAVRERITEEDNKNVKA